MDLTNLSQCVSAMDYVKDWKTWRNTLHEAVDKARSMGLSEEQITNMAEKVGNWLSTHVCPATKEEEILTELWNIGDPDERRTLATLIVKLVSQDGTEH